jgi:hypothetical protein
MWGREPRRDSSDWWVTLMWQLTRAQDPLCPLYFLSRVGGTTWGSRDELFKAITAAEMIHLPSVFTVLESRTPGFFPTQSLSELGSTSRGACAHILRLSWQSCGGQAVPWPKVTPCSQSSSFQAMPWVKTTIFPAIIRHRLINDLGIEIKNYQRWTNQITSEVHRHTWEY